MRRAGVLVFYGYAMAHTLFVRVGKSGTCGKQRDVRLNEHCEGRAAFCWWWQEWEQAVLAVECQRGMQGLLSASGREGLLLPAFAFSPQQTWSVTLGTFLGMQPASALQVAAACFLPQPTVGTLSHRLANCPCGDHCLKTENHRV